MKGNPELLDLIIFGSTTRGSPTARDIDIAALALRRNARVLEEVEEAVSKALPKRKVEVVVLSALDLFKPVWGHLLFEGVSVRRAARLEPLRALIRDSDDLAGARVDSSRFDVKVVVGHGCLPFAARAPH